MLADSGVDVERIMSCPDSGAVMGGSEDNVCLVTEISGGYQEIGRKRAPGLSLRIGLCHQIQARIAGLVISEWWSH
jgi:hypothetical protein